MNVENVRNLLPNECIEDFDNIVNGVVLGASNHIQMIINMYVQIAKENDKENTLYRIEKVGTFFKETRGKSSYAIINALKDVEKRINSSKKENIFEAVSKAKNAYFEQNDKNIKNIILYTERLIGNHQSVLLFDYSSTVEKAICALKNKIDVYIPESRVIAGGFPYVKKITESGHQVHFIADAAMLSIIDKVDLVFIGAETFYPDGTAFNTVGSDILAELCLNHNVPYYVLTPLLKCDIRALYGIFKDTLETDLKNKIGKDWPEDLREKVDFKSIELVGVDSKFITGYITEQGIIRPGDLFSMVEKEESI